MWDDGLLTIPPRTTLALDTYFNALYERQWRMYTRVQRIALRLDLCGRAVVRIRRRLDEGEETLIWEGERDDLSDADILIPDPGPNYRQWGILHAEIMALDDTVTVLSSAWLALDVAPAPVRLAIVFCTFNREGEIARVLATLAAEPAFADAIERILIVDQGRDGLVSHPVIRGLPQATAKKISFVRQGNFGGAGGFGRGLLEVRDDGRSTHVVLADDDVQVEPESILRMHAFFRLARDGFALGGHMLDAVRPWMLYEAGATVDRQEWSLYPIRTGQDLREPRTLAELLDIRASHYNGWWLFGFPIDFVEQVGMPLPCFIRGDDIEFGIRLHNAGLHTVALPGVAIWHEPFYLKIGGWQLYYETRNMLITAALHFDFRPGRAAWNVMVQCLRQLLTFRYYSAALILRGAEDFLAGPTILRGPPLGIHSSLIDMRARYPVETVAREYAAEPARTSRPPRSRAGRAGRGAAVLMRNMFTPTRPRVNAKRLPVSELAWAHMGFQDAVAVDTYWDRDLIVLRRSRPEFRTLSARLLRVLARIIRESPRRVRSWRAAFPDLASPGSWQKYLGITQPKDQIRKSGQLRPEEVTWARSGGAAAAG